jgi:hypothetical protein
MTMPHTDTLSLSEAEIGTLRSLAGVMIPASAEYGVPGADDPAIFASLLASLGRDAADVKQALEALTALSATPYADLPEAHRAELAAVFNARPDAAIATLHRVLLLCYYRDDRVMQALGQEQRPPFPKGFSLEHGDWSLLDPVRTRGKRWRDAG